MDKVQISPGAVKLNRARTIFTNLKHDMLMYRILYNHVDLRKLSVVMVIEFFISDKVIFHII